MDGLSVLELRVKVRGLSEDSGEDLVTIWETRDQTRGDWKEAQALYTFTDNHTVAIISGVNKFDIKISNAVGGSLIALLTSDTIHRYNSSMHFHTQLVIEAVPAPGNNPFHIFRGHVAVDDLGVR